MRSVPSGYIDYFKGSFLSKILMCQRQTTSAWHTLVPNTKQIFVWYCLLNKQTFILWFILIIISQLSQNVKDIPKSNHFKAIAIRFIYKVVISYAQHHMRCTHLSKILKCRSSLFTQWSVNKYRCFVQITAQCDVEAPCAYTCTNQSILFLPVLFYLHSICILT